MSAVKKYIYIANMCRCRDMNIIVDRHSLSPSLSLSLFLSLSFRLSHTHHMRVASNHRCVHVSPESNNITSFSTTIRLGRPSAAWLLCLCHAVYFSLSLPFSLTLCLSCACMALWCFSSQPAMLTCTQGPISLSNTSHSAPEINDRELSTGIFAYKSICTSF